jgi:hypothetical protein
MAIGTRTSLKDSRRIQLDAAEASAHGRAHRNGPLQPFVGLRGAEACTKVRDYSRTTEWVANAPYDPACDTLDHEATWGALS